MKNGDVMNGNFSENSVLSLVNLMGEDFSSLFEFTRCQRPDGSYYGSRGKCVKGQKTGQKQQPTPSPSTKKKPKQEPLPKTAATKKKPKQEPLPKTAATKKKPKQELPPPVKSTNKPAVSLGGNDDPQVLEKKKKDILDRVSKSGVKGKQLKDLERLWNRRISAAAENRKFAEKLSQTLPKEFKTSFSEYGVEMTTRLKSGDVVTAVFSPKDGFHFTINGETDAGSVRDRRSQIRAAFTVRTAFRAVVDALPEGSIIRTGAHTGDGKGAERVRAYTRMGFSQPETIGDTMFAVVGPGGSVVPATDADYKSMSKKMGTLWFAEGPEEDIKLWLQAIFGLNFYN